MTRRERIAAIRAELAARLESGELAHLDALCWRNQYRAQSREIKITGAAYHARRLLEDAKRIEQTPAELRTPTWRLSALHLADDLEHLAAWLAAQDELASARSIAAMSDASELPSWASRTP